MVSSRSIFSNRWWERCSSSNVSRRRRRLSPIGRENSIPINYRSSRNRPFCTNSFRTTIPTDIAKERSFPSIITTDFSVPIKTIKWNMPKDMRPSTISPIKIRQTSHSCEQVRANSSPISVRPLSLAGIQEVICRSRVFSERNSRPLNCAETTMSNPR